MKHRRTSALALATAVLVAPSLADQVSGNALVVSSDWFGGDGYDSVEASAIGPDRALWLVARSTSDDIPGIPRPPSLADNDDALVVRIDAATRQVLSFAWLDGDEGIVSQALAFDASGTAYIAGSTSASQFGGVPASGRSGGGSDAFVARVGADATGFDWVFVLGGEDHDTGRALAVTPDGDPVVAGETKSADFPATPVGGAPPPRDSPDAYVARIRADGTAMVGATVLGGPEVDRASAVGVLSDGGIVLAGGTLSSTFPDTVDGAGGSLGLWPGFVAEVAPSGTGLVRSRILAGTEVTGLGVMTDDSILCAGRTTDSDLPVDRHRHTRDAAWGDDGEIDAVLFRLGGPQFEIQGGVRFGGDRLEQRPGLSISPDGDTVWLAGATASGDLAIPGTEGSSGGVYAAAFDASTYELLGGVKFRLLEGGSGTVAAASGAEAWLCVHSIRQWLPLVDPVGLGTDDTHPSQVHLSRVALAGLPRRPRAPSDVAAVPLSPRRVRVQWTAGAGSPAGFAIDRDLGNGFERVAALPGTATEFDDGDVPADASVAYTVRALGDHGDSPLSAEARAVTPASLSLRFDSGLQTLRRKRTDATLRLKGSLGAPSGTTAEVDPVRDGLTLTMFAATGPVVLVELGAADGWWAGGPRRKTWRAPGTRVDWRPRERVFTVRVKRATPYLSGPGTFAVRGQTPSGEAGTASLSWRRDRGTALRAP